MGLTSKSTGIKALDMGLNIKKDSSSDVIVALAGNPNVGKSSVFNILTGLKQHTGNWSGKTVTNAQGKFSKNGTNFIVVDIPGTYSLLASSKEEEVARDFICFGNADVTVIVCDATCLERNLILVLQTMEVCENVILCVNLIDEARKKKIQVDIKKLSEILKIPVVGISAKKGENINSLVDTFNAMPQKNAQNTPPTVIYSSEIETKVSLIANRLEHIIGDIPKLRWLALKILENDSNMLEVINKELMFDVSSDEDIKAILSPQTHSYKDIIISTTVKKAEEISSAVVEFENDKYNHMDRKIDRLLTSKLTGFPIMIALLGVVFWLTISGANYPSEILSNLLFKIEEPMYNWLINIGVSFSLSQMLVYGCYRVLAWVVSVMLPPMAIFFPLFTLLEDLGYLPRVAFNLDGIFRKCGACGKQALSTCIDITILQVISAILFPPFGHISLFSLSTTLPKTFLYPHLLTENLF